MSSEDAFADALKRIEQGGLSLVSDAPKQYLRAVMDLYNLDPQETEQVLLRRARESDVTVRQRYIYALMYSGGLKEDFSDDTFEFLAGLCERPAEDAGSREAAVAALSWSSFTHARPANVDVVYNCLEGVTSRQPPVLTSVTLDNAKSALRSLGKLKTLYSDLAAGRVVVPESVINDLLASERAGLLAALGYSQSSADSLARLIAWTSMWLWASHRKRRTREFDFYEIGTEAATHMGQPRGPLSVIWKVDRRTNEKTVVACYVGKPGSRPELFPG